MIIYKQISANIIQGPSSSYIEITSEKYKNKNISIAKFRVANIYCNRGKSGGFRIIALVDNYEKTCIVFHIFGKNVKVDIKENQKKFMKEILNDYISSRYLEIK